MKYRLITLPIASIFLTFSILFITSCTKENSSASDQQEIEASAVSSESDGQAEIIFNNVFDDAMGVNEEVGLGGTGVFGRINSCPTVTLTRLNPPNPFPVRVVLDFGTGCVGNDGHFRKGKVITEYTKRLIEPAAIATTTFDGFYFDSVKVEGTHRITNTSTAVSGNTTPNRSFRVEVINGKLTRPNTDYVEWNSTKTITQIEGLTTAIPLDDIFRVEGSARGKTKRGPLLTLWESTIIEPLIKRFNCHWIVKGKVRTVRVAAAVNSPWVAVLDFGNGICDNIAWVTINNGTPRQITLP